MAVGFNYAQIANGLSGLASNVAFGATLAERTVDNATKISNALLGTAEFLSTGSTDRFDSRSVLTATGGKPTEWLNSYIQNAYSNNGIIRYMYQKLFQAYTPDISGYTLLFMMPPILSGYLNQGNANYNTAGTSFITEASQLFPLLATQFSPPTIQMNTGTLAGSSGTQHYATELNISDNMSVTYLETVNLDIYSFHKTWLQYIYQVLEGTLEPSGEYLTNRTIDYAASFYFVKFKPSMFEIQYIGKAIGCFPKELPSPDVVGNRSSNEVTNISFNYTVSDYREATAHETGHWLFEELQNLILSQYGGIGGVSFTT